MPDLWDPFADPAEAVQPTTSTPRFEEAAVAARAPFSVPREELKTSSKPVAAVSPAARSFASTQSRVTLKQGASLEPRPLALSREDGKPLLKRRQQEEVAAEIQRLKAAKEAAVAEEQYEEAAILKRQIKVLEDTLGEADSATQSGAPAKSTRRADVQPQKALSQMQRGEALWKMPSSNTKLMDHEREFLERSKMAIRHKSVTDDTMNGVPQWAYKDALKEGVKGVKTSRPAELDYVFKGQIEDEPWEDGAYFQTSVIVQVPIEIAFSFATTRGTEAEEDHSVQVEPGCHISYRPGIAQLTELLGSEVVENDRVAYKITVAKEWDGNVRKRADAARQTRDDIISRPFYSFRSVWRLQPYPSGGTRITRIIHDFKQFGLPEFDALCSVSRAIEIENEEIRRAWTTTLSLNLEAGALSSRDSGLPRALAKRADGEMYSACFVIQGSADEVFATLLRHELVHEYRNFLVEDSYVHLDETRCLIRQANGIVTLVTSRVRPELRQWSTVSIAHLAGRSIEDTTAVTETQVLQAPFYRVSTEWFFTEGQEETLVRRTMHSFKQMAHGEDFSDIATILTEEADEENRKLVEVFRRMKQKEPSSARPATAISMRAKYAMRQMPEIIDQAAKNNVLEVREMLEVKGADPNYIHVRRDTWAVSDSRLEFFEEITPLIAAAEHGACDVIKVLFDHPQIDVNLCCCAFSDLEIYNYYTAYDVTITRQHPHAAALLRVRGVLPSSSEHVVKPTFDRLHGRPLRHDPANMTYKDDQWGEDAMPSWELVSKGKPALAEVLHKVAETLSSTRALSSSSRAKIFKDLAREWHPDRHRGGAAAETATNVFQWLQAVKSWYMEASFQVEKSQPELPDDPDVPTVPKGAKQYMHPSGTVFKVW